MSGRMGTTFRYIADAALTPCLGERCQHCEQTERPIYHYSGEIADPALAANPALAREAPDIEEACAACILGGNLWKGPYETAIATRQLRRHGAKVPLMLNAFQRTPSIPLFLQYFDWPVCCEEWCEFTGIPDCEADAIRLPREVEFWAGRPTEWNFVDDLRPEELKEVNLFHCLNCPRRFFVWQCT